MLNISDNYSFYRSNELVIDDFDYTNNTDLRAVWAKGGDGGDPTVRDAATAPQFKVGLYSSRFPITDSTHTSTWTANGTLGTIDASDITTNTAGAALAGKLKLILTRSSTSTLTAVTLRMGIDSSNYFEIALTLPSTTSTVEIPVNLSSMTVTGTPNWSLLSWFQIRTTSTSGSPTLDLSGFRLVKTSVDVTGGVWGEDSSQVTNGNSLHYISWRQQNVPTLLHAQGGSSDEVFNIFKGKQGSNSSSDNFTKISKFRWKINGTGQIGIGFNLSSITAGAQNGYVAAIDEANNLILFSKFVAGTQSTIKSYSYTPTVDTDYWLKVERISTRYMIYVSTDGLSYTKVIDQVDTTYSSGEFGTYVKDAPVAEFYFFKNYTDMYVEFDDWSFHERGMVFVDNAPDLSSAKRNIQLLSIAKSNSSVLVSDNWKEKYINVSGKIYTPGGQSDFAATVDNLKRNLQKQSRTLRVGYRKTDQGVFDERIYTNANVINLDDAIKPEAHNRFFVPFNVTFQVPNGFGSASQGYSFKQYAWTSGAFTLPYQFKGSASPLPTIKIVLTDATPSSGSINSITLYNNVTKRQIQFTPNSALSDGDVLTFDFAQNILSLNGNAQQYIGFMDDSFFQTGFNSISYSINSSSSLATYNDTITDNRFSISGGTRIMAQSFQVGATGTFNLFGFPFGPKVTFISVPEAPVPPPIYSGQVTLRIETDNAGAPSGTLVDANATATINFLVPDAGYTWHSFWMTAFSLTGSTSYWMVLSTPQSLYWRNSGTNNYANGVAKLSTNSGASYGSAFSQDACFSVYATGPTGISGTVDVSYRPRYA